MARARHPGLAFARQAASLIVNLIGRSHAGPQASFCRSPHERKLGVCRSQSCQIDLIYWPSCTGSRRAIASIASRCAPRTRAAGSSMIDQNQETGAGAHPCSAATGRRPAAIVAAGGFGRLNQRTSWMPGDIGTRSSASGGSRNCGRKGLHQLPVTAPQYRHGRASSLSFSGPEKTCMAGLRRPRRNELRSTWHRITCNSNVPSCSWRPPLSNFPIESFRSAGNRSQARTAGAVTVGMPRAAGIATEIIAIAIMAEKIWLKFIEPTREAFRPGHDGLASPPPDRQPHGPRLARFCIGAYAGASIARARSWRR